MKYTVIDNKKKTLFIQQNYEKLEEAQTRLDALKAKFAGRYSLAIVGVDADGNFQDLADKTADKAPSKPAGK